MVPLQWWSCCRGLSGHDRGHGVRLGVAGATAGLDLTDSTVVDSTAVLPELLGIYLDHVGAPGQYEATWAATGPTDVQVSQLPVLLSSSGSYTWAIDRVFFTDLFCSLQEFEGIELKNPG